QPGQRGPVGLTGLQGPAGAQGPAGVLAFSEYSCRTGDSGNAVVPVNTDFLFTPTGNSGGGGVGGNAVTSSFLLQPGIYQIQFATSALPVDSSGAQAIGQASIAVVTNGSVLMEFLLTGREQSADFFAFASGSKLLSAGPNQTLSFRLRNFG